MRHDMQLVSPNSAKSTIGFVENTLPKTLMINISEPIFYTKSLFLAIRWLLRGVKGTKLQSALLVRVLLVVFRLAVKYDVGQVVI